MTPVRSDHFATTSYVWREESGLDVPDPMLPVRENLGGYVWILVDVKATTMGEYHREVLFTWTWA